MKTSVLRKTAVILIYATVIVTPLLFWRPVLLPFQTPKTAFFQIAVELLAGVTCAAWTLGVRRRIRRSPLLITLGVFGLAMLVSGLQGIDRFRSLWSSMDRQIGLVGIAHFIVFTLALLYWKDDFDWKRLWGASFFSSVAVALFVPFETNVLASFLLHQSASRPGSTFGNATFMSGYLLFHVFIGGWFFKESEKRTAKIAYAVGIVLLVLAMFLSQTVGDIAGLAAGIVVLLIFSAWRGAGRMRIYSAAVLLLILICGGGFFAFRTRPFLRRIPGVSRAADFSWSTPSVLDRLTTWKIAVRSFGDKPILGWGWENFNVPFSLHYDPALLRNGVEGTVYDKPHDMYLEYLVTGGAIGLLTYLALLGALGYELVRAPNRFRADWRPFFAAALIAYLVQNAVVFDTIGTYLIFFVILAFVDGQFENERGASAVSPVGPGRARVTAAALVGAVWLLPVFFLNIPMLQQAGAYYDGINYFLNVLPESSSLAWDRALAVRAPYTDYVRKDYAATLSQGLAEGIVFPNIQAREAQAISELKKSVLRHPHDYFFALSLADFYNAVYPFNPDPSYLTEARQSEAQALAASPDRQQIYFTLARTQVLENDIAGAAETMRKAIALNPQAGDPHFFYGLIAYQLGNIPLGDREITTAALLGRGPQDAQEAINLGTFVGDKKGDYAAAIQYFGLAIRLGFGNHQIELAHEAQLRLAIALLMNNQLKDAKTEFQALIQEGIDLKSLSIWPQLKPRLDALGVKY